MAVALGHCVVMKSDPSVPEAPGIMKLLHMAGPAGQIYPHIEHRISLANANDGEIKRQDNKNKTEEEIKTTANLT